MERLLWETMECRCCIHYWCTYNRRYKDNENIMENIHAISIETVKTKTGKWGWFQTRSAFRKGSVFLPILFDVVMERIANKGTGGNAMCWMNMGSKPSGQQDCLDTFKLAWNPPSLLHKGYSFSGVRRLEHGADHPPLPASGLSMGTAISLPPLFAYLACNGTALPFIGNKVKYTYGALA